MPKIAYIPKRFRAESLEIIALADEIASDYRARGFNLTLRQLYYQFIARDVFPNTESSYNRLGSIVNDARLAGLIDWRHLEDRGRTAYGVHWLGHQPPTEESLIRNAARGYSLDLWEGQERRVEVWVEKQALEEVAQRAAGSFRAGYFACKGYVSQSEMWAAGQRLAECQYVGQEPLILHLGDHDPSGIDMTRDIAERLSLFAGHSIEVRRLALNMEQIEELNPPPNPAKVTDSRFADYQEIYGDESWELDAISPERLIEIIKNEIVAEMDVDKFNYMLELEREGEQRIVDVADRWDEVRQYLDENPV